LSIEGIYRQKRGWFEAKKEQKAIDMTDVRDNTAPT